MLIVSIKWIDMCKALKTAHGSYISINCNYGYVDDNDY